MKVYELENGEVREYNDSYAARRIEQGKAVILPEEDAAESDREAPAEEAPAAEGKAKKR